MNTKRGALLLIVLLLLLVLPLASAVKFDIEIVDFQSPIKLGEFFEFTYFLKGMADINDDVEIQFLIEKDGVPITSGSDTFYMGNFEEKTKTTKLFLPSSVTSGIYDFKIQLTYGAYVVKAHRTIEIEVSEGLARIGATFEAGVSPLRVYITSALIGLAAAVLCLVFYIERRKIKKEVIEEERWIKKHKATVSVFFLFAALGILAYYLDWLRLVVSWISWDKIRGVFNRKLILEICFALIVLAIVLIIAGKKGWFKKIGDGVKAAAGGVKAAAKGIGAVASGVKAAAKKIGAGFGAAAKRVGAAAKKIGAGFGAAAKRVGAAAKKITAKREIKEEVKWKQPRKVELKKIELKAKKEISLSKKESRKLAAEFIAGVKAGIKESCQAVLLAIKGAFRSIKTALGKALNLPAAWGRKLKALLKAPQKAKILPPEKKAKKLSLQRKGRFELAAVKKREWLRNVKEWLKAVAGKFTSQVKSIKSKCSAAMKAALKKVKSFFVCVTKWAHALFAGIKRFTRINREKKKKELQKEEIVTPKQQQEINKFFKESVLNAKLKVKKERKQKKFIFSGIASALKKVGKFFINLLQGIKLIIKIPKEFLVFVRKEIKISIKFLIFLFEKAIKRFWEWLKAITRKFALQITSQIRFIKSKFSAIDKGLHTLFTNIKLTLERIGKFEMGHKLFFLILGLLILLGIVLYVVLLMR